MIVRSGLAFKISTSNVFSLCISPPPSPEEVPAESWKVSHILHQTLRKSKVSQFWDNEESPQGLNSGGFLEEG